MRLMRFLVLPAACVAALIVGVATGANIPRYDQECTGTVTCKDCYQQSLFGGGVVDCDINAGSYKICVDVKDKSLGCLKNRSQVQCTGPARYPTFPVPCEGVLTPDVTCVKWTDSCDP